MKKITSAILVIAMLVLAAVALVSCTGSSSLKLGVGTYSEYGDLKNADGDVKGSTNVVHTIAAVLVDKDGKIVKCVIDAADNKAEFTSNGKAVVATEYKTKYELGDAYNMKKYGKATYEWYEQADKFAALTVGKTLDEVKALVASDGKGTGDVVNAGCTIIVREFVLAIEEAINGAKETNATADSVLKLGVVSVQAQGDTKDATEEANGAIVIDTTAAVVAMNDGKITATAIEAVSATLNFDIKGEAKTNTTKRMTGKAHQGTLYKMAQYGKDLNGDGVVKEWFEQAQIFEAACEGKTADEVSALVVNGYGVESLQNAACTIAIADFVKAVVKAAK